MTGYILFSYSNNNQGRNKPAHKDDTGCKTPKRKPAKPCATFLVFPVGVTELVAHAQTGGGEPSPNMGLP